MSTLKETLTQRAYKILTDITDKYGSNYEDTKYVYHGGIAKHISKIGTSTQSRDFITDDQKRITSSTNTISAISPKGTRLQTFFSNEKIIMPQSVSITQGVAIMKFNENLTTSEGTFNGIVAHFSPFQQEINRKVTTQINPSTGEATQYKIDQNDYVIGGTTIWGLSQRTLEPDLHTDNFSIKSGPFSIKASFSQSYDTDNSKDETE